MCRAKRGPKNSGKNLIFSARGAKYVVLNQGGGGSSHFAPPPPPDQLLKENVWISEDARSLKVGGCLRQTIRQLCTVKMYKKDSDYITTSPFGGIHEH